jgi:hypothetical protein
MYISEWDLHGAATTTCSHKGEIYTQDMALMYISDRDPQPVHKGEIYQGHGIPPCIYQNGIYTVPRTTSLYKGRNTPRDMAFLHVYQSEWDLPAACIREKYTPRDMAFLRIYQNGTCPLATTSFATREKYTPRDMAFLHVYIRMGSHGAANALLPAACATREK